MLNRMAVLVLVLSLVFTVQAVAGLPGPIGGDETPAEPLGSGETIFYEDWEYGYTQWGADPPWQVGVTTYPTPYWGDECAGTILEGNYPETSSGRLYSELISLPAVDHETGEKLILEFFHYFRTVNSSDYGVVQIYDGAEWVNHGGTVYYYGINWTRVSVDLTGYAGTDIKIGFYFRSISTDPYHGDSERGWYVDNIRILKGTTQNMSFPYGFEVSIGEYGPYQPEDFYADWWANRGLWQVGTPSEGLSTAYRGDNCACTVLDGNYPETSNSTLYTPFFKIPQLGTGEPVHLRFQTWYRTINSADALQVKMQCEGNDWVDVGSAYYGDSSGWSRPSLLMPACADSTIRLAFQFYSSSTDPYHGDSHDGVCIDHLYFEGLGLLVTDLLPDHADFDVDESSEIQVTLTAPADVGTIDASSFLVTGERSGPISGTFSYAWNGSAFTFTPDVPFDENEIITCRLTDAVLDEFGLALDGDGDLYPGGDLVWEFCTYDHACDLAPPVPTDLAAEVAGTTVTLTWDIETEEIVDVYNVYRGETPEGLASIGTSPVGTMSYDDDTGIAETQYLYAVKAMAANGRESEESNEVCATPGDVTPPARPLNFGATTGDRLATLTWDDSEECDLVAYWITRADAGGEPAVIDTIPSDPGSRMTYADDTIENYVEYCYSVQAVDNAGLASEATADSCVTADGPDADLSIVKTVDADSVDVGATVAFTLEVTNNGPDPATDVLVLDLLPENLTFVSYSATQGEYGELTGEWAVGALGDEATASLTLNATVDVAADTLRNTATVSAESSLDIVPENDASTAWVVGHACDLVLTKTVDDTDPNVGDEIVFKVVVVNDGPDEAVDVVVEDPLPDGLYYTSVVKSAGTYIGDNWRLGDMPVGRADSMMVHATVLEAASITNTATITVAHPPDIDPANNAPASATIAGHSADLSLRKTADPISPQLDDPVVFSLIIRNDGPSTAYNVVVMEEEPTGLSDIVYDAPAGTTFDSGTWTIPELGVGGESILTISAVMATEDPVTNSAHIASSDQADPDPNNDVAYVSVSPFPVDVSVTKSVDVDFPALGDTVTFTVIVENLTDSDTDASGLRIMDRTAPDLIFVDASPSAGGYDAGTGVWSLDALAYGERDTLILRAEVKLPVEIVNTAAIVGMDQADPNQSNNSAEVSIVGQAADLAITKTLDNAYPDVDDIVTFVVTVKNNGPSAASDVHVQDLLPASILEFNSYEQTGVDYDSYSGDWNVGELAVGEGNSKTLTLRARALTTDPFTVCASFSGSSLPDSRDDNDMACAGGNQTFADLGVSKSVSDDAPPVNTEVTYTITVSNDGPNDTSDIVIRDVLPPGVTWVSDTASAGDYDETTGLWSIDSLLDQQSATLDIVVTADALEEITNQAEVVSLNGIDDNPQNDTAIEDMRPIDPPPAIVITDITAASVGEAISVTATATDNSGVQAGTVTLHHCEGASGVYTDVVMSPGGTADTYTGTIPGTAVTAVGVDCYVSARDVDDNLGESAHGEVVVTVPLLSNTSTQPGGEETSAYRMISIPLTLNDDRPGPVFEDDLGTYDPARWRLFGLNESQSWENSEFPNCGDVIPGRGFFLIVKEAGKVIDAGPGGTVPTDAPFEINLHSGWNLIGNPYNFTVSMVGVSLASGNPVDMRNFVGSWATLSGASSLEPFNGYLVASDSDDEQLLIDPLGALNKVMPAMPPEPLWAVGIEAAVGGARDVDNVAAVHETAETAWDRLDRPEPPVIGDYVGVSFPHPEWETPFPAYCKDARPEALDTGGHSWAFEVRTNVEGRVALTFTGLASVPDGYQVWLRDELLMINVDLSATDTYTFVGASSGAPRSMTLVVGGEDYVAEALPVDESIPRRVTLFENFPNPFNPLTTIRYGLPRAGRAKLGIYDLRGRLVSMIVNEEQPAGYHAAVWEGGDHAGRRVSSGVYLYRLVTDDAVVTRKMLLMK